VDTFRNPNRTQRCAETFTERIEGEIIADEELNFKNPKEIEESKKDGSSDDEEEDDDGEIKPK